MRKLPFLKSVTNGTLQALLEQLQSDVRDVDHNADQHDAGRNRHD
jgi:hypothetical protein